MAEPTLVSLAVRKVEYVREHERYEVRLNVRFATASEFVCEYAENLSQGGLFVSGAHELPMLSYVDVEVALPGYGTFDVHARVAHILPPHVAARIGRPPGAGLEIVEAPARFDAAVKAYLWRLGRRRDVVVMVDSDDVVQMLSDAGYVTMAVPPPDRVIAAIARCRNPVLAIVVSDEESPRYLDQTIEAGGSDMVVSYRPSQPRDLLPRLDALL